MIEMLSVMLVLTCASQECHGVQEKRIPLYLSQSTCVMASMSAQALVAIECGGR